MSAWQPIETAKWDEPYGPPVLLYQPNAEPEYRILVGYLWGAWTTMEDGADIDPTHWMPLPAPPEPTS